LVRSRSASAELAEEITQSVFVTVSAKLGDGGYDERGRFESWLFRVAMNRLRDEARRVKRQARVSDPESFSSIPGENGTGGHAETDSLEALREAVGSLGEADKEIIHLRHHAQMSFRQIADLLDEPLGTLLARHHRALRKLKQIMSEQPGTGTDNGSGS